MTSPSSSSHMIEESQLYMYTFQGKWEEVVNLYQNTQEVWSAEITSSEDTALHMAINEDKEDVVESLVKVIIRGDGECREEKVKALGKKNEVGDTPLHRAAVRGSVTMCGCIVEAGNKMKVDLLRITNQWGETPIFKASLHNRKLAFIFLLEAANGAEDELLRSPVNGDTVLHSAIRREHFELAFHIMRRCPDLVGKYNEKGMTPLHILAGKPSAFRSGYQLSWWQEIIYFCIGGKTEPQRDPENQDNYHFKGIVPENYATCFQFLFTVLQNLSGVLGFGKTFDEIIKARQKHTWSVQILDELMNDPGKAYTTKDGSDPGRSVFGESHDLPDRLQTFTKTEQEQKGGDENKDKAARRTDTALMVAAQKGVVEVVNRILERLPVSIHDTSSMKKNIVLVAVENKQPRILEALYTHLNDVLKKPKLWQDLVRTVDTDDNTILHLAAKYDDSVSHPWQIHGSAMQMQWEIKWYQHVKSFPPPHFVFLANKKDETPGQIFTRDHKELVKNSSEWLKDTSESCSVVAALVAGVSFATSSAVPGGINDETGKPKLEGRPAFELFAVTALIGLCFSVTALIMFLSILTSRKQDRDFRRNLPLKLLLGLSSLFVSITSMLISFCAAHFFVLEDKFKEGVFPLYAASCLPVSIYAIAQFPLYLDLFKAIVTRVPQPHHFRSL